VQLPIDRGGPETYLNRQRLSGQFSFLAGSRTSLKSGVLPLSALSI